MRQKIACAFIASALAEFASTLAADVPIPDVRAALAERYPAADVIHGGELQFEQQTPVEPADLPALAKALPNVRFFTTKLRTGYYEYPRVSVAVAVPRHGPIAMDLSPTYSESDREFTEMLKSARVLRASEQRAVANDIARLFAIITYKGEVRKPHYDEGRYSAELWHGDLLWRRVLIEFENGHVSSVTLVNPKDAATGLPHNQTPAQSGSLRQLGGTP
ncbi:MAG TPA: hypothetical protein VFI31_19740 [Pirellulales bacterium]|nr:hypothetical protein [Pirellulales bacterium]